MRCYCEKTTSRADWLAHGTVYNSSYSTTEAGLLMNSKLAHSETTRQSRAGDLFYLLTVETWYYRNRSRTRLIGKEVISSKLPSLSAQCTLASEATLSRLYVGHGLTKPVYSYLELKWWLPMENLLSFLQTLSVLPRRIPWTGEPQLIHFSWAE